MAERPGQDQRYRAKEREPGKPPTCRVDVTWHYDPAHAARALARNYPRVGRFGDQTAPLRLHACAVAGDDGSPRDDDDPKLVKTYRELLREHGIRDVYPEVTWLYDFEATARVLARSGRPRGKFGANTVRRRLREAAASGDDGSPRDGDDARVIRQYRKLLLEHGVFDAEAVQ